MPGTPQNPKVSVVMPCYNVEKTIEQCLSSVMAQTLADIEIIVLNDGSKDSTLDIVKRLSQGDSRVHVIDKPNEGYGRTVNRGFDMATGEYVAIVETDDYLDPHMYEDLYKAATSYDPRPDVVKSAYWRVVNPDTDEQYIQYSVHKCRVKLAHQPFTIEECPLFLFHHPSIWSAIYRKGFLDENGIRLRSGKGASWEDNPFQVETLCLAKRIVYVDEAYYYYREDNAGSSSILKDSDVPYKRWIQMADFLDEHGIDDPGVLEGLYGKGFAFISGIEKNFDMNDPEIRGKVIAMYKRMKPEIVLPSAWLPTFMKKEYLLMTGYPSDRLNRTGYMLKLVRDFGYTTKANGIGSAFRAVGRFWSNHFGSGRVSGSAYEKAKSGGAS